MNQSSERGSLSVTKIGAIGAQDVGQTKTLVARVQASRPVGAKMVFLTLRQRLDTIQSILTGDEATISKAMLKFAAGIAPESLVLIKATVVQSAVRVTGCTVQDFELKVLEVRSAFCAFPVVLDNYAIAGPYDQ